MPEIRHQIGFQGIRRSMPEGSADDWPGDSGFQHMRCRPVAENVRPSAVTWVLSYIGFLVYTEGDVCNRLAGKAAVRLYFRNENMPVSTAGTTGIHVIKDAGRAGFPCHTEHSGSFQLLRLSDTGWSCGSPAAVAGRKGFGCMGHFPKAGRP